MVAVADQGGQDLPVPRKIAQMADGFSQQRIKSFAKVDDAIPRRSERETALPIMAGQVVKLPYDRSLLLT
jgi:hypothetical protein